MTEQPRPGPPYEASPQWPVVPASVAPVSGPTAGPVSGPVSRPAAAPPPPPPPPEAAWRPERIEVVSGTPFGVAHLLVPPVTSGLAAGALVAGIASILVSTLVVCFGLTGVQDGWGGWVAGAFAVLAMLAGAAAVGLGLAARRQIRRSGQPPTMRFAGKGLATAGVSCGAAGLAITVLALALVLLLQLS